MTVKKKFTEGSYDCPKSDTKVTVRSCFSCGYWMSIKKCGYLKDGKRGGGDGKERYVSPPPVGVGDE